MQQRSEDNYGRLLIVPEIRFAHAAVSRLMEPAPPVVTVYGRSGTGKTHLARHILREITKHGPNVKHAYYTGSEFTVELAKASKAKSMASFQEVHRRVDLLIVEDLQALERHWESQQQLLAIVDAILAQSGRVLLTSNKPPGALAHVSAKLTSRSQGGITAAIEMPSQATREKLLRHFAEERGFALPGDVASMLAQALPVSTRELKGIAIQLETMSQNERKPIDREVAQTLLQEAMISRNPSLAQITKVVARVFDVTARELKSAGRLQSLVLPRQIAMFAGREWCEKPYSEIGKFFGRRSHSTIVHACQRIRDRMQSEHDFRQLVESIHEQLNIPVAME